MTFAFIPDNHVAMALQNHFESRAWWAWSGIILLVYLFTTANAWQCEGVDEVEYLSLAHSIRLGMGYTQYGTPHVYYPPVYSAFLSPWMAGPEFPWKILYSLNGVLGWLALVVAGMYLRQSGRTTGRVTSWLLLSSYYGWSFSTRYLMAEPLYLLLVMSAVYLAGWRNDKPTPGWKRGAGITALALAAIATKTAGIALGVGLMIAGVVRAVNRRSRRLALPGVSAFLVVMLFTLAWDIRGTQVAADARESYVRWILHLTGISKETEGMIARNKGEDRSLRKLNLPGRVLELARQTGQYATSLPRVPGNFHPLACFLALSVLLGILCRLRRTPHDALSWYGLSSMAMFVMTHWTTSYLRYLYIVSPWIFAGLVEGMVRWTSALRKKNPLARLSISLFCLWGIIETFLPGARAEGLVGAERYFNTILMLACGFVYWTGLGWNALAFLDYKVGIPSVCLIWGLAVLGLGQVGITGMLIGERYRQMHHGQVLKARNLSGMMEAGKWMRAQGDASEKCFSSMSALASLSCGRVVHAPKYEEGRLQIHKGDVLISPGDFQDFFAYRVSALVAFRDEIRRLQQEGRLERVFAMDGSEIYKVRSAHDPHF